MNLNKYQSSVNSNFVSSLVYQKLEQKKTPKVLLPLGFLNFVGTKRVLHSHFLNQKCSNHTII